MQGVKKIYIVSYERPQWCMLVSAGLAVDLMSHWWAEHRLAKAPQGNRLWSFCLSWCLSSLSWRERLGMGWCGGDQVGEISGESG